VAEGWVSARPSASESGVRERGPPRQAPPASFRPDSRTSCRSVRGGPGLLLDDEVALDGEDAAAVAEIQEVDQLRVDVELVAVLTQSTRDAEAEPLAAIRHPERRIEPGGDQAPAAARAALAKLRHRAVRWASSIGPTERSNTETMLLRAR